MNASRTGLPKSMVIPPQNNARHSGDNAWQRCEKRITSGHMNAQIQRFTKSVLAVR